MYRFPSSLDIPNAVTDNYVAGFNMLKFIVDKGLKKIVNGNYDIVFFSQNMPGIEGLRIYPLPVASIKDT